MSKQPVLWVVEMLEGGRWLPTAGAQLSRKDARRLIECDWQVDNPDDKFRVVAYVRRDER